MILAQVLMSTKDARNEEAAPDTIYPKNYPRYPSPSLFMSSLFLGSSLDGNVLRSNILYKLEEHLADL